MRKVVNEMKTCKDAFIHFVAAGEKKKASPDRPPVGVLREEMNWEMKCDLDQQLRFPTEITQSNLRPDIVIWSSVRKLVLVIELTVPWEENVEEAYERKKLRYTDLAADCKEKGWRAIIYPVEVGCRV
jgi:hypothetical protein